MTRSTRGCRSAFSLLEVLLAVLVLAIGLLGLAAVFPVVISQQRTAVEITTGSVVSSSVADVLRSNQLIDWRFLIADETFGSANFTLSTCPEEDESFEATYLWEADWTWGTGTPAAGFNEDTGSVTIDPRAIILSAADDPCGLFTANELTDLSSAAGQLLPAGNFEVPASARLSPLPYSGSVNDPAEPKRGQPRFVYDFVPRRTGAASIEIAGFVRRVDTNIRVPAEAVLSDVLTNQEPAAAPFAGYVPVSFDTRRGLPTRNGLVGAGRQVYSRICSLAAEVAEPTGRVYRADQVVLSTEDIDAGSGITEPSVRPGGSDPTALLRLAAQPGQQLIDNLGTVRTVVEVIDIGRAQATVRVEPPYAISAATPQNRNDLESGERGTRLLQVVFTPEIPIRAFVERVYP